MSGRGSFKCHQNSNCSDLTNILFALCSPLSTRGGLEGVDEFKVFPGPAPVRYLPKRSSTMRCRMMNLKRYRCRVEDPRLRMPTTMRNGQSWQEQHDRPNEMLAYTNGP
eukprot:2982721-Amphidinium_carterae.1